MQISLGKTESNALTLVMSAAQLQLLRQALVEALMGIGFDNLAGPVGVSEVRARNLIDALGGALQKQPHDSDGMPLGTYEVELPLEDARAFRNSLELVMIDLGNADFQTRTGFYPAEGAQMLDNLNAALIAPLHIDRQHRAGQESQVANT